MMGSRKAKVNKINYIYNDSDLFIVTAYVPCGSIYEHLGEFKGKNVAGMSHFLEHLLFKHTENFSGQEILKAFTQIGGYYNASTDKDQTMYYVKTMTDNFELATRLIYDIVVKPIFHEDELDMERRVVLEELASSKDNLGDIVYEDSTFTLLSQDNPYLPSVIGKKSHLKAITTHDVVKYYKKHYNDIMIVISCDKKARSDVHKFVTKLFGANKSVAFEDPAFVKPSLRFVQTNVERLKIVPSITYQYNTSLLFPSFKYSEMKRNIHLGFVKFCLADAGLFSIMTYEIREKRGLVYSIRMVNERMRYVGVYRMTFGTSNKDLVGIMDVILSIMSDMKQFGLSKKNLTFFRTSYKNHLRYKFANEEFRASWMGDNLFYGCPMSETKFFDTIDAITNDDIKKVCTDVFNFDYMGVYSTGSYMNVRSLKKEILGLMEKHTVCAKHETPSSSKLTLTKQQDKSKKGV